MITGPLTGIGRATALAEMADAILFLASEKASFITGQIIDVNGDRTAS